MDSLWALCSGGGSPREQKKVVQSLFMKTYKIFLALKGFQDYLHWTKQNKKPQSGNINSGWFNEIFNFRRVYIIFYSLEKSKS